ncbi:MAG TPA: tetratricopeptide repeat protein, partial [Opitutaceae bacterium]|nr:tetratricopeptide repeat protein [Opitutaceae bacterium]
THLFQALLTLSPIAGTDPAKALEIMNPTKLLLIVIAGMAFTLPMSAQCDLAAEQARADRGDVAAMIEVGLAYHRGDGVPVDYAKAMDWYLKAYDKADGDALNNIAVMYRDGLGVPKNTKVAYLLLLAVHMEGRGTEATQMRAGRNLGRLAESMPQEEIIEALSYTWSYVDQIVRSRGSNLSIGKNVLPSRGRPRIRDNNWWMDSERAQMTFESPAPWGP